MTQRSSIAKIIAVASSLALLAGYVWHSQITPNVPPPDPLGMNFVELTLEPEVVEFDKFVQYGGTIPSGKGPRSDLRIISSKVINQPIFSIRKLSPWKRPMMPGSKSAPIEISQHSFRLNEGLPTFDLFGQQPSTKPAP
jgi:hypothetical protein